MEVGGLAAAPQAASDRGLRQTRGILYVATGKRHAAEMLQSALSVRNVMPETPIVLYTDQKNLPRDVFAEIRPLENPKRSFMDKIAPLLETPFERTIFLDTDTHVCAPVDDLFELLDRFELAVSHAPFRHDRPFTTPNCFCELNTGVVAYRKTQPVKDLFSAWQRLYEEEVRQTQRMDSDQPAFREAAYRSSAAIFILPQEYNLRTVMPAAVGRCAVRIIHGRAKDMNALARRVNGSRSIRLFVPDVLQLSSNHFAVLSAGGRILGAVIDAFVRPAVAAEAILRKWKRRLLPAKSR